MKKNKTLLFYKTTIIAVETTFYGGVKSPFYAYYYDSQNSEHWKNAKWTYLN